MPAYFAWHAARSVIAVAVLKPASLSRGETTGRGYRSATGQVTCMKHPSSRIVLNHWSDRRRSRSAPERADIDPGAIRHALGDTFMLAADFVDELRFRLAGTRVCALFGREVKGEAFRQMWSEESRGQIDPVLRVLTEESVGTVAGLIGTAGDGSELDIELLLLPLAYSGQERIRALGVLAPVKPPFSLGEKPVIELGLRTLRHIDSEPQLARMSPLPRRRHGFIVYRGGREAPERAS